MPLGFLLAFSCARRLFRRFDRVGRDHGRWRGQGQRSRAIYPPPAAPSDAEPYEGDLGSKGHLSDIEKGLVIPTVKTLRVLAERLDVLVLDLVIDPEADPRQKLIDRTRGLTRGTLRKLLGQIPAASPRRDTP
jgi:transcriptional regulator with XRE-family HTH domain